MEEVKVITGLIRALSLSLSHHSFCGWGDKYERECAENEGLEAKIDMAIEQGEKFLKRKGYKFEKGELTKI